MIAIELIVKREGNLLNLSRQDGARVITVGTQHDNEACELTIIRDSALANDAMVLVFPSGRVILGQTDTYIIPNSLTQSASLNMSIAFLRHETEIEHTNTVELQFRFGIKAMDAQLDELPDIARWSLAMSL